MTDAFREPGKSSARGGAGFYSRKTAPPPRGASSGAGKPAPRACGRLSGEGIQAPRARGRIFCPRKSEPRRGAKIFWSPETYPPRAGNFSGGRNGCLSEGWTFFRKEKAFPFGSFLFRGGKIDAAVGCGFFRTEETIATRRKERGLQAALASFGPKVITSTCVFGVFSLKAA